MTAADTPISARRAALRHLLARREDGYSGIDLARGTRLGAVLWLLGALAVVPLVALVPPTATIGGAGWAMAALLVLGCLAAAARLLHRGERINPDELLALSYASIAAIAAIEWLAGGRDTPYDQLYLLAVLYAAAVHPPRRVLAFLSAFAAIVGLTLALAPWAPADVGDALLQVLIVCGLALVTLVLMEGVREQRRSLREEGDEAVRLSRTDPLTGLGNRRALTDDLAALCRSAQPAHPHTLLLFDLDGFKAYNDSYGHEAGDELLARLAGRLSAAVGGSGATYRMGGDEFCVLAPEPPDELAERTLVALAEAGEGFSVSASHGGVVIPSEARDASAALRCADQRMYARKSISRVSAGRQSADVLVQVLAERSPDLGTHLDDVTGLCEAVADRLSISDEETVPLLQAAALHDVGKAAVPDAILSKPGPLDPDEWAFMRSHTIVGERILLAAPALARAGRIVRASHERFDGTGYPDGLAGESIPAGARVIAACDAFDAMTSDRPYRQAMSIEAALSELRRCAGSQFDPIVVAALEAVMAEGEPAGAADAVPA